MFRKLALAFVATAALGAAAFAPTAASAAGGHGFGHGFGHGYGHSSGHGYGHWGSRHGFYGPTYVDISACYIVKTRHGHRRVCD